MGEELNIRDLSGNRTLVVFDTGDEITVQRRRTGHPLPAVTGSRSRSRSPGTGPIVMNSREELMQAMKELQNEPLSRPIINPCSQVHLARRHSTAGFFFQRVQCGSQGHASAVHPL